jgi:hypothetical protein
MDEFDIIDTGITHGNMSNPDTVLEVRRIKGVGFAVLWDDRVLERCRRDPRAKAVVQELCENVTRTFLASLQIGAKAANTKNPNTH